ncbi:MAG: hypothetical protein ABI321_04265 [Polyangia bacterium]
MKPSDDSDPRSASSDDTGLRPALADGVWTALEEELRDRPFLRSEGLAAALSRPATAASWLVEKANELVTRFDRFYRAIVDAKGALAAEPARQIGQPYERIAEAEGDRSPLVLGRYDCVLDADGKLRVIELNPIGVSTLHQRGIAYMAHALHRQGDPFAASLDAFSRDKTASMRRFIDETVASKPERPTVGLLLMPGMHRGSKLQWAHELRRAGLEPVLGRPGDVRVDGGGLYVGATRVDALWADWVFYLGYQQQRYEQTRFASKVGDYSNAGSSTEAVLSLPGFAEALAERTFTIFSPLRSYRALSKALLAWIDRPELPLTTDDRAYLHAHVAETIDHRARHSAFTPEEARRRRAELVLKPCRFGGSHGVLIGRDVGPDAWAHKLDEVWSDPEWVLQDFIEPNRDLLTGAQLSYGIYDYLGTQGGILVRSADTTIISARTAGLIAACPA